MAVTSMANSSIRDSKKYNNMSAITNGLFFWVEYLVLAGGGAGGSYANGLGFGRGGGGGGYRSSVVGELSGSSSPAEPRHASSSGQSFTVTVGAGNGGSSTFANITSTGGGFGGSYNGAGGNGGSGGATGGLGIAGQGSNAAGSNGGGAGAVPDGRGGAGLYSSITGSSVGRGGGGGGAYQLRDVTLSGGKGSMVDGQGASGGSAPANRGGGGGGAGQSDQPHGQGGGSGGSGVVILKYPASEVLVIGPGLVSSTATVGDYKVTTFTGGTDTVTVA